MNILTTMRLATAATISAAVMLASGCGGGSSSAGEDGSPIVSRGVVTGFGSIYVNGHKFITDAASFEVDDESGGQDDLRVGMIVTVVGSRHDSGDQAHHVYYDNELKGPVSDIQIIDGDSKTLTILGQSVLVTRDTTIDDDGALTYDTIAIDDVLEVSGFLGEGQLIATHIELQDSDDEIEIKGLIENFVAGSFEIKGFPVTYDINTEIDDDIAALDNGLFVEVEGQLDVAGTTLLAKQIEAEDDDFDDDNEVELRGVISEYDDVNATFMLQGQMVDAKTARLEPVSLVLANDLLVEVEGYMDAGILIAHQVELED